MKLELVEFNQANTYRFYNLAKYALVLMINRINTNQKQPIA